HRGRLPAVLRGGPGTAPADTDLPRTRVPAVGERGDRRGPAGGRADSSTPPARAAGGTDGAAPQDDRRSRIHDGGTTDGYPTHPARAVRGVRGLRPRPVRR